MSVTIADQVAMVEAAVGSGDSKVAICFGPIYSYSDKGLDPWSVDFLQYRNWSPYDLERQHIKLHLAVKDLLINY